VNVNVKGKPTGATVLSSRSLSRSLLLRPLASSDLPAVAALIGRTIDTAYPPHYGPGCIAHFREHHSEANILEDAAEGCCVVAEEDGAIVGTGTLTGAHVRRVFVEPSGQRRGIGRAIMRELEARAAASGAALVELASVLGSRAFYEALGYVVRELKSYVLPDGEEMRFYIMTKLLLPSARLIP